VRKNRSAGVSPASEPRQLLLGQHDLCRLEAGDTFFLTTTETRRTRIPGLRVSVAPWPAPLLAVARGIWVPLLGSGFRFSVSGSRCQGGCNITQSNKFYDSWLQANALARFMRDFSRTWGSASEERCWLRGCWRFWRRALVNAKQKGSSPPRSQQSAVTAHSLRL